MYQVETNEEGLGGAAKLIHEFDYNSWVSGQQGKESQAYLRGERQTRLSF